MLVKKYKKARLTPYSKLFFQLGLLLSLVLIYIALEWKTVDRVVGKFDQTLFQTEEIMDIPITERILEIKPPPPPPPAPEVIEIVADQEEIIETVLESTETDESEIIKIQELDEIIEIIEEEEIEKDIPFAVIEEPPVYPGCTGTKAQKRKCLQNKITAHVNKHFRIDLAQDLGLSPGKKKVYIQFRIDENGEINNVRARGPHKRLEKEAVRVIELLPKMTPGKQRTRPVRVSYTLPLTLIIINQ
ncbi:MAG: energy transducer TonB [Flavobacteriaceae bacterium]|nr:energy transducer TonB [Flavobacteriaceae bacterium]